MSGITGYETIKSMMGDLQILKKSQNTKETYLKGMGAFEKFVNQNLDELIENCKVGDANPNILLKSFVDYLASKNLAPKTIAVWVASVRVWFRSNGISLDSLNLGDAVKVHKTPSPSKEEVQKVLESCNDLRIKSIILILSSSGIKIDELTELQIKDVKLDSNPVEISVGNDKKRTTFISNQAKNVLSEYLKKRKDDGHYLTDNSYVIATNKNTKMSRQDLQFHLKILKKHSTKEGKRYGLNMSALRKFFKKQFIIAGIPHPIIDTVMGKTLEEDDTLNFSHNDVRNFYLKAMKYLETDN